MFAICLSHKTMELRGCSCTNFHVVLTEPTDHCCIRQIQGLGYGLLLSRMKWSDCPTFRVGECLNISMLDSWTGHRTRLLHLKHTSWYITGSQFR